ncbi:hypothetical protein GCM10027168_00810 [Streptomyces capparidis]
MTVQTDPPELDNAPTLALVTAPPPPPQPSTAAAPADEAPPLPGVPLLTGTVNAVGVVGAVTGPVGLAVVGAVGVAAGVGAMAGRVRSAARRRAGTVGRAPAAGAVRGLTAAAGRPTTTGTRGAARIPRTSGTSRPGGPAARTSSPGAGIGRHRRSRPNAHASSPLATSPAGTRGRMTPLKGAGAVGRAAARAQQARTRRAERAAGRSADRAARGVAKAERAAGLTPNRPGGAARKAPKGPGGALRRSALRHGARMGAAGLAAGLAGLAVGAVRRSPRKGWRAGARLWRRLSERARAARARRDARILGKSAPGETPVPGERVNDPRRPATKPARADAKAGRRTARVSLGRTSPDKTSTGGRMSAFTRLSDAAEEMYLAASKFDPDEMEEFQVLIEDLPTAMVKVQETIRVLAEISDERLPVDKRVVEEIGEGFRAMNAVITALEGVPGVYYRVHEDDIARKENPRNGLSAERKWNV